MKLSQENCRAELEKEGLIPRKYHGQVFTTDRKVIDKLIETIKSIYKPGTKIVEIGGGLGYITEQLVKHFDDVDVVELDEDLYNVLNKKFIHKKGVRLIHGDIMDYKPLKSDYLFVGNIPFHISGRLYRRFMSDERHKPYGMVFITDKQYARTLMGQPPRCYRVSLQAQIYGNIEIVADVPPEAVYPPPKVTGCIMKITHRPMTLPKNFWVVVNYHFENFPTKEVESPKTLSLEDWIKTANLRV
ncbi:hypothetical protein JXA05_03215 [Candidatus Peregrinibacteria bacterium]|nr:hypothetical protein [Candidatus Peregrinibacteria bacterium]